MVGLHLKKHGGSPAKSLAGIPATILTTENTLVQLTNPETARTLGLEVGAPLELDHTMVLTFGARPELAHARTVAGIPRRRHRPSASWRGWAPG